MQENRSTQLKRMLTESRQQQQMGVKNPTVKTGLNTMGVLSAGKSKTTVARFGLKKAGI